ncbi:hypothetical protein CC2G_000324 [Coprinopsis cinerea AmutBmut pab1-1]|nr:hypothetical protein CC2G_000324 [Coprinopsis cinerea AmutBmut pab1-1]
MDLSHYKQVTVSRGYKYNYYAVPPVEGKPTLLFVHGFPSTAQDWRRQVAYFKPKGYGFIIPDMLGYGGTDKPLDHEAYVGTAIAKDLYDIVEAEGIGKVIAIGHDWGSVFVSRLANLYQDRFAGFAFLAVGYMDPRVKMSAEEGREMAKKVLGYESTGYWWFFSSPEAPDIIRKHIDSFYDIIWAKDPSVWKELFCGTGSLQSSLESNTRVPRADSMPAEEYRDSQLIFLKHGYEAPCLYYKAQTTGAGTADATAIPEEKAIINKPVLFLGAEKDAVCVPNFQKPSKDTCPNSKTKVIDSGHWLMFDKEEEVNIELESWFKSL